MEMKALEDLFLRELSEMYDAERQIVAALPKMAKATDNPDLRSAFETHLKQTQRHVERLEKVFKALEREAEAIDCDPITEIIKQGDAIASTKLAEPPVVDAALISAAQKVEHYEIALYGSARSHAKMLGYSKIADLLETTLREEEETDLLLTHLATKTVNPAAAKAPFAKARTAPRGGDEGGGMGLGGLILGVVVGAVAALLYAPKSGELTRQDLMKKAKDLRAQGEDLAGQARQSVEEKTEQYSKAL